LPVRKKPKSPAAVTEEDIVESLLASESEM
jgi:hypothetical protein